MLERTTEEKELQYQMGQKVAIRNDLITQIRRYTKSRSGKTLREMRLVLFALSKIRPTDTPSTEYEVSIRDFFKLCGLSETKHTELKKILISANEDFFIEDFYGAQQDGLLRWFDKANYNRGKGTITFRFCSEIQPYLFELRSHFTSYPLYYIMPMRSRYSIRIYELLKSVKGREPERKNFPFLLADLQKLLLAENYCWDAFRRKVLEPALGLINSNTHGEVNIYSDLRASYRIEKQGRSVHTVIFFVTLKNKDELQRLKDENENILMGDIIRPETIKLPPLKGQVSMEDIFPEEINEPRENDKTDSR